MKKLGEPMNRTKKEVSTKSKSKTMNRKILYIIAMVIICTMVFGIPIIINELYKKNTGYMTLWGAKEVYMKKRLIAKRKNGKK